MHVEGLRCVECGKVYSPENVKYFCDDCGSSLDVIYNYEEIRERVSWELLRSREFSHLRYREFLPLVDPEFIVRMGEGGTPLIRSTSVGDSLGIDLRFKLENLNPTGSFKDRGTSVELGKALEHGADNIVTATTGNMGSSIAAYCARAGVYARIYIPDEVDKPKLKHTKEHGAEVISVDGDYTEASKRAWEDREMKGMYLMGDYPYRGEGEKTMGHEIGDQFDADVVFAPVGNGTLVHGLWKGLRELEIAGLCDSLPRLVGVQAEGCDTVATALRKGLDEPIAVPEPDTVADAISCGDPLDGDQAIIAIRESNGSCVLVDDEEILEAKKILARDEGIYAEEAGAVALAGLMKRHEDFSEGEKVVCLITGHGLKT